MGIQKYAVTGHPIGHTMSPFIHSRLFALENIQAEYGVFDIPPETLGKTFETTLKQLNGFNITIPHKQSIIPLLDELDPKAKLYGSVNTVALRNGITTGYTTDPDGFLKALEAANIPLKNKAVILGCGGVARTMAYEALFKGCDLTIAVRKEDMQLAALLCEELKNNIKNSLVSHCLLEALSGDIDLLINATPVGMYPNTGAQPVSDRIISRSAAVFDAVYNPLETVLIQKAKANGSLALGGMSMLVWQAAVSHEIWNGSSFRPEDMETICLQAAQELQHK